MTDQTRPPHPRISTKEPFYTYPVVRRTDPPAAEQDQNSEPGDTDTGEGDSGRR
jgi:hypothetical protein